MRALGALPMARANQDLAVPLAFPAMKFVYWHKPSLVFPLIELKTKYSLTAWCGRSGLRTVFHFLSNNLSVTNRGHFLGSRLAWDCATRFAAAIKSRTFA